jgi:His/Glu/Gln/Arg/opine family amino acid ABC transporter permease subunit
MQLDWLPQFGQGLLTTVMLSLVSLAGSLVLGTLVGVCRAAPARLLRVASAIYVEALRNLPPLLLLFFIFFALPHRGIVLEAFPSAALALSVYGSAFVAEAVRGGILAVSPVQIEAARGLGLSYVGTMRYVVLPVALVAALPALTNVLIALIKTTALAGALGVADLMSQTKSVQAATFRIFEAYGVAAACYLALIGPLGAVSAVLERRYRRVFTHDRV